DRGERDAVVDLRDLVERARRVLRRERDPVLVREDHDGPAARDALAREVRPVLHELLGRDVEGHVHSASPPDAGPCDRSCGWSCGTASALVTAGRRRGTPVPERSATISSTTAASSSSGTRS